MRKLFLMCFLTATVITLKAQGTLQFNAAKIVSNTLLTVPANKVWKLTSIYGFEANICVTGSQMNNCYYSGSNSVNMSISAFKVNGSVILSECTPKTNYQSATCTGTNVPWLSNAEQYCGQGLGALGYATKLANPNILPMWLPAGTTIQTNGPNTFLSVIEFNIIP